MAWINSLGKISAVAFLLLTLSTGGAIFPSASPAQWEAGWEKTVKAAEQEGEVVIYKLGPDWEWNAFQKRFPKIKIVTVSGGGSETLQRVMAERRAGKFLADVVRLGGGTSTTLYKAKALDPITPNFILPEVKDQKYWFEGKHHFNDIENRHIFLYAAFPLRLLAYNTKLVDPRAITSFHDLLDPKWRGKITAKDPRDPGGGSPLLFIYYSPQLGPGYLKRLITEGGLTLVRDERQQTDWLASGRYPIAITAKPAEVEEAKRQGLPVDVLDPHATKKDGVGLESGGTMISLVNRAPHPNAAKVLINWFLSREGQLALQKGGPNDPGPNSLREDISKEDIPPFQHRVRGVNYLRLWGTEVWDRDAVRKLVIELGK